MSIPLTLTPALLININILQHHCHCHINTIITHDKHRRWRCYCEEKREYLETISCRCASTRRPPSGRGA